MSEENTLLLKRQFNRIYFYDTFNDFLKLGYFFIVTLFLYFFALKYKL